MEFLLKLCLSIVLFKTIYEYYNSRSWSNFFKFYFPRHTSFVEETKWFKFSFQDKLRRFKKRTFTKFQINNFTSFSSVEGMNNSTFFFLGPAYTHSTNLKEQKILFQPFFFLPFSFFIWYSCHYYVLILPLIFLSLFYVSNIEFLSQERRTTLVQLWIFLNTFLANSSDFIHFLNLNLKKFVC